MKYVLNIELRFGDLYDVHEKPVACIINVWPFTSYMRRETSEARQASAKEATCGEVRTVQFKIGHKPSI